MISGTDMAGHLTHVDSLQLNGGQRVWDYRKAEDRLELLRELLHVADLGAAAKSFPVCRAWYTRITDELHRLDDRSDIIRLIHRYQFATEFIIYGMK